MSAAVEPSPATCFSELASRLAALAKSTGLPSLPPQKTAYPFVGFQLDAEDIELTGTRVGALNRRLEVIFGFGARQNGGIILKECGPNLEAVVGVLETALAEDPAESAMVLKWIDDLTTAAKMAYTSSNREIPQPSSTVNHGQPEPADISTQRKRKQADLTISSDSETEGSPGSKAAKVVVVTPKGDSLVRKAAKQSGRRVGAPGKDVIAMCCIKYVDSRDPAVAFWGCRAVEEEGAAIPSKRCNHFEKGNASETRVKKHANSCRFLKAEFKALAHKKGAESSLGAKLGMVVPDQNVDGRKGRKLHGTVPSGTPEGHYMMVRILRESHLPRYPTHPISASVEQPAAELTVSHVVERRTQLRQQNFFCGKS